jgi:hypothetical protein
VFLVVYQLVVNVAAEAASALQVPPLAGRLA